MKHEPGRCHSCRLMIPKMPDMTWEEWETQPYCDERCEAELPMRCRCCGRLLKQEGVWFCNLECEAKMPKTAYRHLTIVEDVEFLLRWGTPYYLIPEKVGSPNLSALSRVLYRLGRLDLANEIQRAHTAMQEEAA